MDIELLLDLGNVAVDLEREQGAGKTASVAEHADALTNSICAADVGNQAAQAAIDTAAVHVAAHGGYLNARLNAGAEALLGQCHEGLLDRLVGEGGDQIHVLEFSWDISEQRIGWVGAVVVVEQACVRLSNKLASWRMEAHVVKTVQGRLLLLLVAVDTVGVPVQLGLQCLFPVVVRLVACIYRLEVASDREMTVHNGVLAGEVGLVEIVSVGDVGATETWLKGNWGIGTDEHGDTASSTSRTSVALLVERNVTRDHDRVTAIPPRGFHPVDRVEQGVGAAVASVHGIHTLDVEVTGLLEQLHQNRLDGF